MDRGKVFVQLLFMLIFLDLKTSISLQRKCRKGLLKNPVKGKMYPPTDAEEKTDYAKVNSS